MSKVSSAYGASVPALTSTSAAATKERFNTSTKLRKVIPPSPYMKMSASNSYIMRSSSAKMPRPQQKQQQEGSARMSTSGSSSSKQTKRPITSATATTSAPASPVPTVDLRHLPIASTTSTDASTHTNRSDKSVGSQQSMKEHSIYTTKSAKLNSSAATLLATALNASKVKHAYPLVKSFTSDFSDTLSSGHSSPVKLSLSTDAGDGGDNITAALSIAESFTTHNSSVDSSAVDDLSERRSSRRSRRQASTQQGNVLYSSASMGALEATGATGAGIGEKNRPKSRKLYLGMDQDDESNYTAIDDVALRKSASALEVLAGEHAQFLKRPPSRQKVAAQNLFEQAALDEALPVEFHPRDSLDASARPRAKSANATPSTEAYAKREIVTAFAGGSSLSLSNDPVSDGFDTLGDPNSVSSPFRIIVTNYEITTPTHSRVEGAKRRRSSPRNLAEFFPPDSLLEPSSAAVLENLSSHSSTMRKQRKNSQVGAYNVGHYCEQQQQLHPASSSTSVRNALQLEVNLASMSSEVIK